MSSTHVAPAGHLLHAWTQARRREDVVDMKMAGMRGSPQCSWRGDATSPTTIKAGNDIAQRKSERKTPSMLTPLSTVGVFLLLLSPAVRGQAAAHTALAQANNEFAVSLYQALSTQPGNIVLSPVSAHSVLTMAWLGAGGHTAREMLTGLRLPDNRSVVEEGFTQLMDSLQSTDTVTLDVANKMYLDEHFAVKEDYRQNVVNTFRSDVQKVNFGGDSEGARNTINQWVQEKTHDKIKDLIEKGTLREGDVMVLVNALYFNNEWQNKFSNESTTTETFHVSSTSTVNVRMMQQTEVFPYAELPQLNATALLLGYSGSQEGSFSMLLLLPNAVDGLPHLERQLSALSVDDIIHRLSTHEVVVSLPRFKLEKTIPLVDTLKKLGINDLFSPGADLSGITDAAVYVSQVLQKAFLEVTEEGTEAAAATYVLIHLESALLNVPVATFRADHPFLFLVLGHNNVVLFMGRVATPTVV